MYKIKLALGTNAAFGISEEEQIKLFNKIGFDGFFTSWNANIKNYKKIADELGMIYQSVHAPFKNAAKMWEKGVEAENARDELLSCVSDCADAGIGLIIVHPYIGFGESAGPTEHGLENFGAVVSAAKKSNIRIAFENVEGEEYLEALMKEFDACDNVGFCWDSGHELCYNRGKDMLALYGKKLIATHINDNLGVSDFGGRIYWTDDLHLLPFDGIRDWKDSAHKLSLLGFDKMITFELNKTSKPNRHDNDKYSVLPIEQYIAECYARACRFASMIIK